MYLFNITINIENQYREEWLDWINGKMKSLLNDKTLVLDFNILKIISEEMHNGSSFSFQYHIKDIEGIDVFEERYDREVAAGMYLLYKEKFVEFRTRLEVIDWKL